MSIRIFISSAILALAFIPSLSPSLAFAEEATTDKATVAVTPQYRKTLGEFLELMGAATVGEQISYAVANETLSAIATTGVQVTEEIQSVVLEEALSEFVKMFGDTKFLTDIYAPLYAEHFDEKEIAELLAFYKSPLGKKTLVALPAIGQAGSLTIQQASYERIADFQIRVDERLRSAGLIESQ